MGGKEDVLYIELAALVESAFKVGEREAALLNLHGQNDRSGGIDAFEVGRLPRRSVTGIEGRSGGLWHRRERRRGPDHGRRLIFHQGSRLQEQGLFSG